MKEKIEELTLLLMYMTAWEEDSFIEDENHNLKKIKLKTCWKGYDFDIINELMDKELLYFSKYKHKTITITPEGEKLATDLFNKYIKERNEVK